MEVFIARISTVAPLRQRFFASDKVAIAPPSLAGYGILLVNISIFMMKISEIKEFIKDMHDETILSISVVEDDEDEE